MDNPWLAPGSIAFHEAVEIYERQVGHICSYWGQPWEFHSCQAAAKSGDMEAVEIMQIYTAVRLKS